MAESIRSYNHERSQQRHDLLNHTVADLEDVKVKLLSPVSSQMKNTFVIKSTSKNMDNLYRNLILRKKE